jgi:ABC-type amino acid transport substrate-binding protein
MSLNFHRLRRWMMVLALLPAVALAATPVRVLVEDAASPWSDHNGVGMANDLVRAAFAAAGAPAQLVVVPYARCKALVLNGAAPSCFSMSAAPELVGSVRFADKPLFSVTAQFYAFRKGTRTPASLAALRPGMRLGIVHGYEYPPEIAELAKRGIVLEAARSEVINLRKLAAGRLDLAVVMTDPLRSAAMLERQADVREVAQAFSGPTMASYIGFSTANPEGERQRQLFNAGFKMIDDNGERHKIEARWKLLCASYCPE